MAPQKRCKPHPGGSRGGGEPFALGLVPEHQWSEDWQAVGNVKRTGGLRTGHISRRRRE